MKKAYICYFKDRFEVSKYTIVIYDVVHAFSQSLYFTHPCILHSGFTTFEEACVFVQMKFPGSYVDETPMYQDLFGNDSLMKVFRHEIHGIEKPVLEEACRTMLHDFKGFSYGFLEKHKI